MKGVCKTFSFTIK